MKDKREHRRLPMHWQVVIVFDEHEECPTFHGVTHDISLGGTSILTDHNIYSDQLVTVLLAIPPMHHGQRKKIVEVRSRIKYVVHASGHDRFRLGLHFERFKGKGKSVLRDNLENRAMVGTATQE